VDAKHKRLTYRGTETIPGGGPVQEESTSACQTQGIQACGSIRDGAGNSWEKRKKTVLGLGSSSAFRLSKGGGELDTAGKKLDHPLWGSGCKRSLWSIQKEKF